MASTADIRNGSVILHKNKRMKIIEFQHVKPGKGGAFVRTKLKDIKSGKIIDETFNAGHKLEFVRVEAKAMQFLYVDGNNHIFMDNDTFDQVNVSTTAIGNKKNFLTSGASVDLLLMVLKSLTLDYLPMLFWKFQRQNLGLKAILLQELTNLLQWKQGTF